MRAQAPNLLTRADSYTAYTDGSCWTGDRIGAYAWVAIDAMGNEELQGFSEINTTISRMELMGPIDLLDWIYDFNGPSTIVINSDSMYVVEGITDRTRKRKVNVDLWLWLDDAVDRHKQVVFKHVRGHAGNKYNEIVDSFAGELRLGAQNEKQDIT